MNDNTLNIVIALNKDKTEIVGAFTDREEAINLYIRLNDKSIPTSIHSVEINTQKDFMLEGLI